MEDYNIISEEKVPQDLDDSDIVVMDREQVEMLGEDVQDIAESSKMVYIAEKMSDSEIKELCGITPEIQGDETSDSTKTATAIMCQGGKYYFNDVYDIVAAEENDDLEEENVLHSGEGSVVQEVKEGIESVLEVEADTTSTTEDAEVVLDEEENVNYDKDEDNDGEVNASVASRWNVAAYRGKSFNVRDNRKNKIGSMGYTLYFYKVAKNGSKRVFDSICVATFAPKAEYACANMSVILNTNDANDSTHSVLEATNLKSNAAPKSVTASLSIDSTGVVSGGLEHTWTFDVNAQKVTKSFDMNANKRKWIFKPEHAIAGDAWIEEPGVRMVSKRNDHYCYTRVTLKCPFVSILGRELSANTGSYTHKFQYK